jgi:hypothetical protein
MSELWDGQLREFYHLTALCGHDPADPDVPEGIRRWILARGLACAIYNIELPRKWDWLDSEEARETERRRIAAGCPEMTAEQKLFRDELIVKDRHQAAASRETLGFDLDEDITREALIDRVVEIAREEGLTPGEINAMLEHIDARRRPLSIN